MTGVENIRVEWTHWLHRRVIDSQSWKSSNKNLSKIIKNKIMLQWLKVTNKGEGGKKRWEWS